LHSIPSFLDSVILHKVNFLKRQELHGEWTKRELGDRANKIWRQLSFVNLLDECYVDASVKVGGALNMGIQPR
jgi:hypothetical protein